MLSAATRKLIEAEIESHQQAISDLQRDLQNGAAPLNLVDGSDIVGGLSEKEAKRRAKASRRMKAFWKKKKAEGQGQGPGQKKEAKKAAE